MKYQLKLHKSVTKFLKATPSKIRQRIIDKIDLLQDNPINHPQLDIKMMQVVENTYRLRIGTLRVIYQIEQNQLIIYLLTIVSRGDVYK
ncbi:MAG: type II toxin-antitoxin system RelE/ParE family toxin [Methyloprofundus sp.]|nr:type II toxin-antitoxin system RelE/ParE family toxin [Methyloprofundus sp.]MDT8426841.1 type II toxin-antitoxin system RelE/ParE family toxin [Methyloprofundus sp.]